MNITTPKQVCNNIIKATKTEKIKKINAILEMHEDEILKVYIFKINKV